MITYTPSTQLHKLNVKLDAFEAFTEKETTVHMPLGIIGFEDAKHFQILYAQEELPFMHFRAVGIDKLEFVVVEPFGLLEDYQIEIADADVDFLKIKKTEDAFILNIVTVINEADAIHANINLVGPIVINRHTYVGKQIVISNYKKYSANYMLF